MKKIISIVAAIATLTTMTGYAQDAVSEEIQGDVMLISEEAPAAELGYISNYMTTFGKIKEVSEASITVESAEGMEMVFNFDKSSYLIDANTVLPFDINNRETDDVVIFHSTAMTRSIPPQSFAYAVMGNIKEDTKIPMYTEVEKVTESEDGVVITTERGEKEITLLKDAEISPYLTRNIVTAADLCEGAKVLLWYDTMTMSIPAYASSDRAVILEGIGDVTVGGIDIDLNENEEVYEENGVEMVPVRTVAETLGFEVNWEDATQSVTLVKDNFTSNIVIGDRKAGMNKAIVELLTAPVLKNDKTYVPMDYFEMLNEQAAF